MQTASVMQIASMQTASMAYNNECWPHADRLQAVIILHAVTPMQIASMVSKVSQLSQTNQLVRRRLRLEVRGAGWTGTAGGQRKGGHPRWARRYGSAAWASRLLLVAVGICLYCPRLLSSRGTALPARKAQLSGGSFARCHAARAAQPLSSIHDSLTRALCLLACAYECRMRSRRGRTSVRWSCSS